MGLPAFDILKFVDELKESGMPEKQAKLVADGFNQIQQMRPITIEEVRHEIQTLEQRIDLKFKVIDERFNSVDARFNSVDEKFHSIEEKFNSLHNALLVKLGAVIIGSVTVLGFVLKLVH